MQTSVGLQDALFGISRLFVRFALPECQNSIFKCSTTVNVHTPV